LRENEKEKINQEWMISPLNKLTVRSSKLLSEKNNKKSNKSIHNFSNNLK
jgi:hypothetical protein